jgi:hypothetical protein
VWYVTSELEKCDDRCIIKRTQSPKICDHGGEDPDLNQKVLRFRLQKIVGVDCGINFNAQKCQKPVVSGIQVVRSTLFDGLQEWFCYER